MDTGKETLVVAGGPSGTPGMPRISADGRRVAYNWNDMDDGTRPTGRSLRVIALEAGANPEILLSQADRGCGPAAGRLTATPARQREPRRRNRGLLEHSLGDRLGLARRQVVHHLKTFEPGRIIFLSACRPTADFAYATEPREGSTDHYSTCSIR